jgi:hypothetical protein
MLTFKQYTKVCWISLSLDLTTLMCTSLRRLMYGQLAAS